jgi:hypothetical protein
VRASKALNAAGRFAPALLPPPTWNDGDNLNPRGGLCLGHPPVAEKQTPRSSTMLAGAPDALRPSGRFDYGISIARRSEVVPTFFKLYSLLPSGTVTMPSVVPVNWPKPPNTPFLAPNIW